MVGCALESSWWTFRAARFTLIYLLQSEALSVRFRLGDDDDDEGPRLWRRSQGSCGRRRIHPGEIESGLNAICAPLGPRSTTSEFTFTWVNEL
jgi:hypothetical protein